MGTAVFARENTAEIPPACTLELSSVARAMLEEATVGPRAARMPGDAEIRAPVVSPMETRALPEGRRRANQIASEASTDFRIQPNMIRPRAGRLNRAAGLFMLECTILNTGEEVMEQ